MRKLEVGDSVSMIRRVVVTGMGVISPVGLTVTEVWQNLVAGKSGVGLITLFDTTTFEVKIAAEVKGFDPTTYVDRKEARHMDRFTQFALAASFQAAECAKLKVDSANEDMTGVLLGSGIGGIFTIYNQVKVLVEKGPDKVNPFTAPMMIADAASGQVSIRLGAKGPNLCATSACSSSSDAIGEAFEIIRRGDAMVMVAGGAEAPVNPFGIAGFYAARALSMSNAEPEKACRPFDAKRDGFIMGEGAAALVLEELEYAKARGATILAEMVGYGATSDAYHVTQPLEDGHGAAKAMEKALKKAGLTPGDVDYINAHGTSTPLNDKCETIAIKAVFGDRARTVPISSTKSMTGHLLGAAGALEAMVSVLTIMNGVVPPTINLVNPDPDCDLDYVPNQARQAKVNVAMSNTFGFGGHNSVLVFRKYTEE
jgi:3-oxoacyl-[acyl-carrier-protein] synthase II